MNTEKKDIETFFTIIIPTRERSDTLIHTLETVLSQKYDSFQVLVSDNASQDGTAEKVAAIKDPRLRYVNTRRRVSMSENWEFALNHVESGWVTVLGDDDAILPGSLNRVNEIINKTGTSAIRSNGCLYQWPGLNGAPYGKLSINLSSGYEIRSSGIMLRQVLDGHRHYNELPMLYNGGFISLDLIKQAKSVTGNFYQSMNPDIYSAIVFSLLTECYVYSREPLAINGASLHSNGTAAHEKKKNIRSYDPVEIFLKENNIPFHEDIPLAKTGMPVRSINIYVYEAFLQAKKFHDFKKNSTSHERQLEVVLRTSGPFPDEIDEWAELFAKKHNIKINKISRYKKLSTWFYNWLSVRLINLFYTYRIAGNKHFPLNNVNDAAAAAGIIKLIRPSRIKNIIQTIISRV